MPLFGLSPCRRFRLATAILAAGLARLAAADSTMPWAVRVWRFAEGMPDDRVASLAQTPDGYLWVVEKDVVAKFDGATFETVGGADSPARALQGGQLVLTRRDGSLALFTDRGVLVQADRTGVRILASGLPSGWAETLVEDGDGALWIGYHAGAAGGRLLRYARGRIESFSEADGLPGGVVDTVACDRLGQLWFCRSGRLGVFRGGRFVTVLKLADVRTRICGSRFGGLWIASGFNLFRFVEGNSGSEPGTPTSFGRVARGIQGTGPSAILEDRSGAVWIGTTASGLFRFDGRGFQNVPISHREVMALLEDREGNIWVGTKSGGLNQVQPRTITVEGSEVALPSRSMQGICEAADGELWGITQDGALVSRRNGGWEPVLTAAQPTPLEATCLAANPRGGLWVGTKAYTLYGWNGGALKSWGRQDGIMAHTLRSLVVARDGDLWIGGEGPGWVGRMHEGRIQTLPLSAGADYLRGMAQDSAGDIWVGGVRAGKPVLLRYHDGALRDLSPLLAKAERAVTSVEAAPDGSLWIGFVRGGIARLKAGRLTMISTDQGLTDDYVAALMPDDRGWIWCAGSTNIFKFRLGDAEDLAAGRARGIQCVQYGNEQGLPNQGLAYGDAPRAVRTHDGRIWIPMATELAIIDPRIERTSALTGAADGGSGAPILVTRLAVDGRVLSGQAGSVRLEADPGPARSPVRVPPGPRSLEVDFTSLSLYSPENVHFRYRLDPFDDHWIEAGTARRALYPHLPAGKYRFEVRACDSDGLWNRTPAVLAFSVQPFIWERWWFRALLGAALVAAMYALARYLAHRRLGAKLRLLEKQTALDQERARIARNLHDDLGSRLTKIVLLTGLVARDRTAPQKAGERNREISDLARQMIASLDETVWAVNPRNDTLPHLIDYLGQSAVTFLRTAEIPCQVELPDDTPVIRVSSDVRHHLFLTVQEALNNVVRHAEATMARLRVTLAPEALGIAIEDNGRGFAGMPEDPGADGLRNMRERMRQIGGSFRIESRPGAGTRVLLAIPRAAWG